ncbi:EexN family lipoprotein [Rodentibacter caecimuris]|uniref:EexN family lipoprotein n=1 Tax=Rodentibacter caecimuris TaxID=1796644 RepID=UPI00098987D9|nr:hypothetical protein BKG99_08370 [Rodentibacter heylii]
MKNLFFIFSMFLMSACNEKTYTVDNFIKDDKLFNEFYIKCENGVLHEQHINCINVKKAHIKIHKDNHKVNW